jgi:5-methylcytosine-specific restriction protein A
MRTSTKTRELVKARAKGRCEICGSGRTFQVHHRRPRGMGGSNDEASDSPANCLYLCGDCHLEMVEVERAKALACGWLVHQGDGPAMVPVLYRGKSKYLHHDGGLSPAPAGVPDHRGRDDQR